MHVLMINGSPHEKGCTYTALTEVAAGLSEGGADSEILWLGQGPFDSCLGCGACARLGRCIKDSDPVNRALERATESDGFIFGSPVHYAEPTGAMKAFLDRFFMASGGRLNFKPAAAVVSCRRGGASAALEAMTKHCGLFSMPIVAGTYWNMVHGSKPEEVRQDLEGMQNMRTLGRNMAWLLGCIHAGRAAGICPPPYESPRVKTNFIR